MWARLWWLLERTANSWRVDRVKRQLSKEIDDLSRTGVLTSDIVVSMTTHGNRIDQVHLTVLSILRGTVRPARLVLWVDDRERFSNLPQQLRELMPQGLEIRLTENLGPHTKYFPMLAELEGDAQIAMVTADDDILYPKYWLARLERAWRSEPAMVHAYRCHRIQLDDDGSFAPYATWPPSFLKGPKPQHFFTGVSGVLYPPELVRQLRGRGTAFLSTAPRADDIWLNFVAADTGFSVRQVGTVPRHFPIMPGSQGSALAADNVAAHGNDPQLRAVYSADSAQRLHGTTTARIEQSEGSLMRVAFVDHSGLPGGGQLGLARYLAADGSIEKHGVVLGGGPAFDSVPRGRMTRLGRSSSAWGFIRVMPKLHRYLALSRCDVVVANSTKAGFALAALPRSKGCTRILYLRSDLDPHRMSRLKYWVIARLLLSRFDAFLGNSSWTISTIPAQHAAKPREIAYPVSGLTSSSTRAQPGEPESEVLRVLSLSRIAEWKGIGVLLDSIESLNQDGWTERILLTIAGAAHHEDENFARLVSERAQQNLPNVRLTGHVSDVSELLANSDVLVLASIKPEPFGQVLIQAMGAGAVVVATGLGGPTEIIEDGTSGLLIEPGDSTALAGALRRLATDPDERRQLAEYARATTSAKFSDDITTAALDSALHRLHSFRSFRSRRDGEGA